ncbi:MAG: hypothetical protein JW720_05560 [Sedimentisphaerales bacterium]|nr:hypothetical protein [Sedimentisphaerales bacterium]
MSAISRRGFLGAAAAMSLNVASAGNRKNSASPIPVLHVTDLFRPHMDPDDHWDLACVYAQAFLGQIDLKAVVIDFPVKDRDPDIAAVAQLNHITGLTVPIAVGSPKPFKAHGNVTPNPADSDYNAARLILDVLDKNPQGLIINITGCSRDVALAGRINPGLFTKNCAAIYLNAGAGEPKKPADAELEYNVNLDATAHAAIFDLPCPIYWMPCFEQTRSLWVVRQFGTYYKFRQDRILPHLSERMQNYFASMLGKVQSADWLRYLNGPRDEKLLEEQGRAYRNMWCTAGFFHAIGKTVVADGRIIPTGQTPDRPVYAFEPIKVACTDSAGAQWTPDPNSQNRHIFRILDIENYPSAMTKAMKSLLTTLP